MTAEERQQKIELYGRAHRLLMDALPYLPRSMWEFRAAPDGWTVHEILIHIADSEAHSFVRLRRGLAEPGSAVIAYDETRWARELDYPARDPFEALELFRWLRQSSYHLIREQPEEVWSRTIEHPENGTMTLDDWLDTYTRHIPDHLDQMHSVYQQWKQQQSEAAPPDTPSGPTPAAPAPDATVTLREVTKDSLIHTLRLRVRADQAHFVAPNTVSIAQAYFERENAWFRAIYADETPVGFLMLDDNPDKGDYFLWRFMIDAAHQGKGYGAQAIHRLVEHVRTRPNADSLGVSYVPGEGSPEGFYRRLGFQPTGEVDEGEIVARLHFDPTR